MYRKHRRNRINSGDVLDFLLKNKDFPRSVGHCIKEAETYIKRLPRSEGLTENLAKLKASLLATDIHHINPVQLHDLMDDIQAKLAVTHNQIASTWFLSR